MWTGGLEVNDEGNAIVLFEPVKANVGIKHSGHAKGKSISKAASKTNQKNKCTSPEGSCIGGRPTYYPDDQEAIRDILHQKANHGCRFPADFSNEYSNPVRNPGCEVCHEEMFLLVQLYAPFDVYHRTLYVFGCNREACGNRGSFCCLRSQVVSQDFITKDKTEQGKQQQSNNAKSNHSNSLEQHDAWGEVPEEDDAWGSIADSNSKNDPGAPDGMDDLEAMLSAYEIGASMKDMFPTNPTSTNQNPDKTPNPEASTANNKESTSNKSNMTIETQTGCQFPYFDLQWYDEPASSSTLKHNRRSTSSTHDNDDDDVGIVSSPLDRHQGGMSDAAIQRLLQNYLKDEDDAELLSVLAQEGLGSAAQHAQAAQLQDANHDQTGPLEYERDERLDASTRAWLAFSDRMKRAPNQVLRYAYGGRPLWSAPPPLPTQGGHNIHTTSSKVRFQPQQPTNHHNNKKKKKKKHHTQPSSSPATTNKVRAPSTHDIPSCSCGAPRAFEFQLMPSILHVLEVNHYVPAAPPTPAIAASPAAATSAVSTAANAMDRDTDTKTELSSENKLHLFAGMNWGVLAVYSCSQSCNEYREEFVLVQDSVDSQPSQQQAQLQKNQKQHGSLCHEEQIFGEDEEGSNISDSEDENTAEW